MLIVSVHLIKASFVRNPRWIQEQSSICYKKYTNKNLITRDGLADIEIEFRQLSKIDEVDIFLNYKEARGYSIVSIDISHLDF